MDKINPLPAKKVIKALETTLITVHPGEDIGKGMIRKIIKDVKITREEWLELIETI